MEGYRTWTGLVVVFLGFLGIGKIFSSDQITNLVDLVFQLGGIIYAMYGTYKAHREIKALGGYRK